MFRDRDVILTELTSRGFDRKDYARIQIIVRFSPPEARQVLVWRFGRRTLSRLLEQIDSWKRFLDKDSFLPTEEKERLRTLIAKDEILVWTGVQEANQNVGPWEIEYGPIVGAVNPQTQTSSLEQKWIATNRLTEEQREAHIPAEGWSDRTQYGSARKRAYESLGLWSEVYKGPVHRGITSKRAEEKSTPHYTQVVIPQLYKLLIPYYPIAGRYSEKRDSDAFKSGNAVYPKDLLKIMLDILHCEEPAIFGKSTIGQIRAALQRHLEAGKRKKY